MSIAIAGQDAAGEHLYLLLPASGPIAIKVHSRVGAAQAGVPFLCSLPALYVLNGNYLEKAGRQECQSCERTELLSSAGRRHTLHSAGASGCFHFKVTCGVFDCGVSKCNMPAAPHTEPYKLGIQHRMS